MLLHALRGKGESDRCASVLDFCRIAAHRGAHGCRAAASGRAGSWRRTSRWTPTHRRVRSAAPVPAMTSSQLEDASYGGTSVADYCLTTSTRRTPSNGATSPSSADPRPPPPPAPVVAPSRVSAAEWPPRRPTQPHPDDQAIRERYDGEEVAAVAAGRDRRTRLDLLDRCRHRQLCQCPPLPDQGRTRPRRRGADRGDDQLFPLRLSTPDDARNAVQHHHRCRDDAVERRHAAPADRAARL